MDLNQAVANHLAYEKDVKPPDTSPDQFARIFRWESI